MTDVNATKCASCALILAPVLLRRCSVCLSVSYCSKKCQKKHWRLAHKAVCAPPASKDESFYYDILSGCEEPKSVYDLTCVYATMTPEQLVSQLGFTFRYGNRYSGVLDVSPHIEWSGGETFRMQRFRFCIDRFFDSLFAAHPHMRVYNSAQSEKRMPPHAQIRHCVNARVRELPAALFGFLGGARMTETDAKQVQLQHPPICTYGMCALRLLVWNCITKGQPLTVDRIVYARSQTYDVLKLVCRFDRNTIWMVFAYYYEDPTEMKRDMAHITEQTIPTLE
jgi:hypothetical protein